MILCFLQKVDLLSLQRRQWHCLFCRILITSLRVELCNVRLLCICSINLSTDAYFTGMSGKRMLLAPVIDQILDKQVKSKAYNTYIYT